MHEIHVSLTTPSTQCHSLTYHRCSLACSKKHREQHPPEEEKSSAAAPFQAPAPEGLSSMEPPDEFNKIFAKYPILATYLHQIANETDPPSSSPMAPNTEHGERTGFKRKQPRNKPWTREIGLQNALQKLRELREQDNSGALQEFCDLVRMTNAQKEQDKDDELRRIEAQRSAEEIGQLIRAEQD